MIVKYHEVEDSLYKSDADSFGSQLEERRQKIDG